MYDRLGAHILGGYGGRLGKPRIVKVVDPSGVYLRQLRVQVGPDCLIVARWDEPVYLGTPQTAAQMWYARHAAAMDVGTGYGTDPRMVFEGANEIPDSQAEAFCRFEMERMRLLHGARYHAAVGSWSVGVPELGMWPEHYAPLIQAMRHGDVVALHEYWVDRADIGNVWHCGRFTLPALLQGVPIAVTECGRDVVEGRGNAGWQGYVSEDDYLQELADYDALIAKYPNVVGACVFTGGSILDPRWRKFDVNGIWGRVVAGYGAAPAQEAAPMFLIDGRRVTVDEFAKIVDATDMSWARIVVEHHTAVPTEAQWAEAGWDQRKEPMRQYYGGTLGWTGGPHLFIAPEGICIFNPLDRPGIAVAGHNDNTVHIEIVGNYTDHVPSGETRRLAVAATAILLKRMGRGLESLTNHRRLTPDTQCPGEAFAASWPAFVNDVFLAMQPPVVRESLPEDETTTEPAVMAEKARWWMEQEQRERESGNSDRADDIRVSLITLLYRLEAALKA